MRMRVGALATVAVAILCVIALPSAASASTEFGDNCAADDDLETEFTIFEISNPLNPLPSAAPSDGVITKVRINLVSTPGSIPLRVDVVHPTGPGQVQIVGESTHTVFGGPNSFEAQVPVKAGDRIGLGPVIEEENLICKSEASPSSLGGFMGSPGVGASTPVLELPAPFRVPVSAVLEPDADHDGFGDETQDKCPQSAATQAACPVLTIDALPLRGKNAVKVLVAVSSPAPVTVTGSVKLGKGKRAKLKAPTKTLMAGPIGKFKLKFPSKLRKRLTELTPNQSLQLKIAADATNVSGAISSDKLKVKLKGEGRK